MYKIIAGSAIALGLFALGGFVLAQEGGDWYHPGSFVRPMQVNINDHGEITLRGVIQSISGNSFTISSWGGTWTIELASSTETGPQSDLSNLAVGNFVGVMGQASQTSLTVTAAYIRNWNPNRGEHGPGMMQGRGQDGQGQDHGPFQPGGPMGSSTFQGGDFHPGPRMGTSTGGDN